MPEGKSSVELAVEKGLLPKGSRKLHAYLFCGYAVFDNLETGKKEIYVLSENGESYRLRREIPINFN